MHKSIKVGCCLFATICGSAVAFGETYRVAANVTSEGGGLSWESPMSITNGIASVAKTGGELWLKGETFLLTANMPTLAPSGGAVTVRGGFAGTETSPEERSAGAKTTIDGQDLYSTFTVTCNKSVTIERLVLTRSITYGVKKTGANSITISQCDFTHNGRINYTEGVKGRCGNFSGGGEVTISDCRAYANWGETYMNYIGTSGFWFSKITKATIERTAFERNGYFGVGRWDSCGIIYCEQTPLVMSDCLVRGNRATTENNSGLIYLFQSGSGSVIKNCLFIGNEHLGAGTGVIHANYSWGSANTLSIENCTFAYNLCCAANGAAALTFDIGTFTVKNCLFTGNLVGKSATSGADISLTGASATCTVSYSMFDGTEETKALHYAAPTGTLNEGAGIRFGNPNLVSPLDDFTALLTTPETTFPRATTDNPAFLPFLTDDEQFAKIQALDAHLLSSGGYFTNDGTEHQSETAVSDAIDRGDPASPIGAEPEPNGGIINIGAYGGTAQASKTPAAAEPAVDSVDVTFEGEYSQPTVTFTLGGSGAYSADAVISISTNGTDWCYVSNPISGLEKGTTKSILVPEYYLAGGKIVAKVSLVAGSVSAEGVSSETEISGVYPAWAGKGGDAARVIHVRPGATCRKDGTSWSDAFVTLDDAFAAVTADRNEIWVAGSFTWTGARASFTFAKAVAIRGGFAGTENAASEREDGALTVIDGHEQANGLTFVNYAAVSIERFRFTNGRARGLDRTSSVGDLTVSNCEFVANGHYSAEGTAGTAQGGGACFVGSGASRLALVNCLFEENTKTNNGSNPIGWPYCGLGAGAYVSGFTRATFEGCRFVRNGICSDSGGFRNAGTRALHIANTPVTMIGCEFRGNGGNTWQGCGPIVTLDGACGGSAFTNCLWVGNNEGNGSNAGMGNSVMQVSLATADDQVDFANCTFAYNVADATEKPAGLYIGKGAAKVRNCIFYGNAVGALAEVGADIHTVTNGNASADIAYTLFGGEGENWASGSNVLSNCTFGDPRFVTTLTDFTNTASKVTAGVPGRTALPSITPGRLVAASAFDVHVLKRSPAIDAGDPKSAYSNEPKPNGHRINLGFYGNTLWAMTSKLGLLLLVQ